MANHPNRNAQYHIRIVRNFYGPKTVKGYVDIDGTAGELWFGTRAEAKAKIEDLDHTVYYLSHNEYSRPEYYLSRCRKSKCAIGCWHRNMSTYETLDKHGLLD